MSRIDEIREFFASKVSSEVSDAMLDEGARELGEILEKYGIISDDEVFGSEERVMSIWQIQYGLAVMSGVPYTPELIELLERLNPEFTSMLRYIMNIESPHKKLPSGNKKK